MTNEFAIKVLTELRGYGDKFANIGFDRKEALDMAIKALKQKSCEDCINRTELLSRIDAERKHLLDIKMDGAEHVIVHHARRIIEDMPSVTPKAGWIPVTERLPDKGYSVLVMRITDDSYKYMRVATYQGDCWMDNTDEFNKPNPHKVIAWMPLPQPYKAESEK